MGGFTDIEHLRRAQMAERFLDDDGPELAGYFVAGMSRADGTATVEALRSAKNRLVVLAAGCDRAANLMSKMLDRP